MRPVMQELAAGSCRGPVAGAAAVVITTFALVWVSRIAAAATDVGAPAASTTPAGGATNVTGQLACGTLPKNLTQCQQTDCNMRMKPLISCVAYLENAVPLPSPSCCSGLQQLAAASSMCFCDVTFYPPPGFNISLPQQHAMPSYCNITIDLCNFCPSKLTPPAEDNATNASCTFPNGTLAPAPAMIILPKHHVNVMPIVAGSITALILATLAVFILLACRRKKKAWRFPDPTHELDEILKIEGKPTVYPYNVLKTATKNFHAGSKLGEGGFGAVYKGVLPDGTEVAVKQLSVTSRQGNEEFLNEVTLITGVQHRNLVKLRGCCLKGDERLLVYEFLANRSLHQALFGGTNAPKLDWPTRLKILLGTARGLAYLHEGCHTRIIHRDIKASNILLDKDLNPKIADFGLARLFKDNQSHVSTRVAGTVGYLAPEYAMRGQLTEKADVFSFGIVALELISGRGNLDLRLSPERAYLLDWTWHLHEQKNLKDLVDPALMGDQYSEEEAMRVIEVALLCTQSVAAMRPTMTRVVELLTGGAEIEIPEVTGSAKPRLFTLNSLRPGSFSWKDKSSKNTSKNNCSSSHNSEEQGSQPGIPSATVSYMSTIEPR